MSDTQHALELVREVRRGMADQANRGPSSAVVNEYRFTHWRGLLAKPERVLTADVVVGLTADQASWLAAAASRAADDEIAEGLGTRQALLDLAALLDPQGKDSANAAPASGPKAPLNRKVPS